jgi:hypothetical protein
LPEREKKTWANAVRKELVRYVSREPECLSAASANGAQQEPGGNRGITKPQVVLRQESLGKRFVWGVTSFFCCSALFLYFLFEYSELAFRTAPSRSGENLVFYYVNFSAGFCCVRSVRLELKINFG